MAEKGDDESNKPEYSTPSMHSSVSEKKISAI